MDAKVKNSDRLFDGDPFAAIDRAHADELSLCSQLEDIADALPDKIDRQMSILTARALWPLVRGVHSFEETVLFPLLERRLPDMDDLDAVIARLKEEHRQDESYAEELSDVLLRLAVGDKTLNTEAAGYMLRGFFEAMRRHIRFEREHLIKPARKSSGTATA